MLYEKHSLFSLFLLLILCNGILGFFVNFEDYGLNSRLQSSFAPDLVIITPTEQYFS